MGGIYQIFPMNMIYAIPVKYRDNLKPGKLYDLNYWIILFVFLGSLIKEFLT